MLIITDPATQHKQICHPYYDKTVPSSQALQI